MAKVKITLDGYKCERCKHEWIPRNKEHPIICPACKSAYWDKPKKKKATTVNEKNNHGKI